MELLRISGGDCGNGDCPAVYQTDRGTLAVQGRHLTGLPAGDGETVVEIPLDVFREAVCALGR